jgi:predicted Zn-dependent protease
MRRASLFCLTIFVFLTTISSFSRATVEEKAVASPVLAAMKTELTRSFEALKKQPVAPYFLCYEITETRTVRIGASFGALKSSDVYSNRRLDIDLRVGDYALDNTHPLRDQARFGRRPRDFMPVPVEDDAGAIAAVLWYNTERAYKAAVEDLTKVRTDVQVKVEAEDSSSDFSREPAQRYIGEMVDLDLERSRWEEKVRRYTAPFAAHGDVYQASADFVATATTRWLVSTEGSEIQTSDVTYRLSISAFSKADDGMELPRYESFTAFTERGLPDDEAVMTTVNRMIDDLQALRVAPVVDPYTGPALLSGRAAGVFFHEVFGHRIEGHRQKREDEGQTFKKKVGEAILPESFSIYFDPTLSRAADTDLAGFYRFDNEGVEARRVVVVEDGVFENFLMSRTPVDGFPRSNGHGRRQPGFRSVARQSNLVVEVDHAVTHAELKRRLIEMVRHQEKPFGLIFEDIQGGFTVTGRTLPNAFNVLPILVYRVFPDGREELVRGVDLIGTPLAAFSSVVAADDRIGVFNGTCGAESGGVPVAAVAPGILIEQIEVQKKEKSQERPPILPAPSAAGVSGRES